jgi:hypothetical protein
MPNALVDRLADRFVDELFAAAQERFMDTLEQEKMITYADMLMILTPEEAHQFEVAWDSRGGFLYRQNKPLPEYIAETRYKFIDKALFWDRTPQGHEYWSRVANSLSYRRAVCP